MPKSLSLGNGSILILLDHTAQVRDLYFPYVGLENHVGGHFKHRIGIYTDHNLRWLDHPSWNIAVDCEKEALAGYTTAINNEMRVQLTIYDSVFNEANIFIRKITITNTAKEKRTFKIFFNQEFELYESHKGDTAYYDPHRHVIIHYKGRRVFLINLQAGHTGFDDYAIGRFGIPGKNGTHEDAEDGVLSKNPIEHGLVDSVIAATVELEGESEKSVYYWMTIGKSIREACDLHSYVLRRSPEYIMKTTKDYWYAWVNKYQLTENNLDAEIIALYKKSLLIVRAHIDNNGGVLAAGDSEFLEHGKDTYAYVWPRDGAFVVSALLEIKDLPIAERFFHFCADVITDDGFLMHKYRPDRSLGSSWHPWIADGKGTLPIQEDETAHVLIVLWKYYELSKNLELIEQIYNSFIKKAAEFLVRFTDSQTGLPLPSYDLWEERLGTTTYTASCVYGGLVAAAKFATVLGKSRKAITLDIAAEKMKSGILKHLYNADDGYFYRSVKYINNQFQYDTTIDMSSVFGIMHFGVLPPDDDRVTKAMQISISKLTCPSNIGGLARYEGDTYYRSHNQVPGNPWFITTLWQAQYYIAVAKDISQLKMASDILTWTKSHALTSGILSEQLDPYTGIQLSASPLTWSHAEFVRTVNLYVNKYRELTIATTTETASAR